MKSQNIKKLSDISVWTVVFFLSIFNYKFAKFAQSLLLNSFPNFSQALAISLPWLAVGFIPALFNLKSSGLIFKTRKIFENWKKIFLYSLVTLSGLIIFFKFGVTESFKLAKYPFVFFLITPIVEELIFRGFIFGKVTKLSKISPVILTSTFFALHHLQYSNYHLTLFAVFQVGYTFVLGLIFGEMRRLSANIYPGLVLHILTNYLAFVL